MNELNSSGRITFHNSGDSPLIFFYVLTNPGSTYTFCDIKSNGGVLNGHQDLAFTIPPGLCLDWRFNSSNDCDNSVVSSGFLTHDQCNGGLINVGH